MRMVNYASERTSDYSSKKSIQYMNNKHNMLFGSAVKDTADPLKTSFCLALFCYNVHDRP